jgi:hypothetical protein
MEMASAAAEMNRRLQYGAAPPQFGFSGGG